MKKIIVSVILVGTLSSLASAQGYQTKDSLGNLVNSNDSYTTRDSLGNLVNSRDNYQTRDSLGNLVNSQDRHQSTDSNGNRVTTEGRVDRYGNTQDYGNRRGSNH